MLPLPKPSGRRRALAHVVVAPVVGPPLSSFAMAFWRLLNPVLLLPLPPRLPARASMRLLRPEPLAQTFLTDVLPWPVAVTPRLVLWVPLRPLCLQGVARVVYEWKPAQSL